MGSLFPPQGYPHSFSGLTGTISSSQIPNSIVVDAMISSSAAITLSKFAALTASKALVSDASGVISVSSVTSTELGYVSGVTSAIQTQLSAKANIASPSFTGTVSFAGNIDLGVISKKFEDFFSGALSSSWTFNNVTGTNSGAMVDGIGAGYKITTGAVATDEGTITFNQIRNFDPASCTFYVIFSSDMNADNQTHVGIAATSSIVGASHAVCLRTDSSTSFLRTLVYAGSGGTITNTDYTVSANTDVICKVVCTAANQKFYVLVGGAWVLKVTQTTTLPTTQCQPIFDVYTAGAAISSQIKYFRVDAQ